MEDHVFKFLKHIMWLADDSQKSGDMRWDLLPKHHYFAHMALRSLYLSPRLIHTYIDESLIGRMSEIYQSSMDGPSEKTCQKTALDKYIMLLSLLFEAREQ